MYVRTRVLGCLVHLDMPLLVLLPLLQGLLPGLALALGNVFHGTKHTRHHALQTAEVDVGSEVHELEDLLTVLLDLVLNVHLATLLVLLLTGERHVVAELVGVLLLDGLPVVIVQESVGVGDAEEEPGQALELLAGLSVLDEQAAKETTVRGDTGTGRKHDDRGLGGLLGHEHNLSGRSGEGEFLSGLGIAEVVGADALLGRVLASKLRIPVGSTTDAKGHGLSIELVTVTGGSNGVETDTVRLVALRVNARGDHTSRLSLPVRHLALVVDDDVAGLTGGLRADNALDGHNLRGERSLVLVRVHRDAALVVVWLGLEEVKTSSGLGGDEVARLAGSTGVDAHGGGHWDDLVSRGAHHAGTHNRLLSLNVEDQGHESQGKNHIERGAKLRREAGHGWVRRR
mmetsp:Transcript_8446/g.16594  ORF Transcript_8446/g.16594 Transcript_8446/m.16594 type:complete len:400 (+) Transcript_8446:260-1459(+)